MRTKGKITHWNEDKGFGFITPSSGAKQVFVHISAFSNPALRPRINQIVTFTLSTDKRGRACAEDVIRDGRTHCSQMTSCAEATYFIQNCPNTKMDGDHDGVPCEAQWCN